MTTWSLWIWLWNPTFLLEHRVSESTISWQQSEFLCCSRFLSLNSRKQQRLPQELDWPRDWQQHGSHDSGQQGTIRSFGFNNGASRFGIEGNSCHQQPYLASNSVRSRQISRWTDPGQPRSMVARHITEIYNSMVAQNGAVNNIHGSSYMPHWDKMILSTTPGLAMCTLFDHPTEQHPGNRLYEHEIDCCAHQLGETFALTGRTTSQLFPSRLPLSSTANWRQRQHKFDWQRRQNKWFTTSLQLRTMSTNFKPLPWRCHGNIATREASTFHWRSKKLQHPKIRSFVHILGTRQHLQHLDVASRQQVWVCRMDQ